VGRAERIEHTEGIGELVPHPVELERLVEAVERAVSGGTTNRNFTHRDPRASSLREVSNIRGFCQILRPTSSVTSGLSSPDSSGRQ
jgi:hypothetical protein